MPTGSLVVFILSHLNFGTIRVGGISENSTWGPRNVWKLEVGTKMEMFFKKEKIFAI